MILGGGFNSKFMQEIREKKSLAYYIGSSVNKADNLLNSVMQKAAEDSVLDVDAVLFVLDGHAGLSDTDKAFAEKFYKTGKPFILALTKTDIMPESLLINELKECGINIKAPESLSVEDCAKAIFDCYNKTMRLYQYYPHFTDEETETKLVK